MAYRQTLVHRWIDAQKKTRSQSIYTASNPAPSPGGAAAITSALQAASHAGLWYYKVCPIQTVDEVPEGGDYPSILDYAALTFRTSAGTTVKLNVPAPLTGLFLAGSQRVDPTNALVIAIVSAMIANATDSNGNAITTLVSGARAKVTIPTPWPG